MGTIMEPGSLLVCGFVDAMLTGVWVPIKHYYLLSNWTPKDVKPNKRVL